MSKQDEVKKTNDVPRQSKGFLGGLVDKLHGAAGAPPAETPPDGATGTPPAAEPPAEEKFPGTSDGNCPVCSEHGEKHIMRVDLKDWTCPRCNYREPIK